MGPTEEELLAKEERMAFPKMKIARTQRMKQVLPHEIKEAKISLLEQPHLAMALDRHKSLLKLRRKVNEAT